MEEYVGQLWHRFISRAAQREFPEAAVLLEDVRGTVGLLFRALGGEGGLRVETATATAHRARRRWLARVAGSGSQVELAWRDGETLRLPRQIAVFPERESNRELYFWLAALAAVSLPEEPGDWLARSQRQTRRALARYPGLQPRYQRLVEAHLAQRPSPATLPRGEAAAEQAIRNALCDPQVSLATLPVSRYAPQPVPLWLHPAPPVPPASIAGSDDTPAESPSRPQQGKQEQDDRRRSAERVDMPDGRDGLLAFRLESLFSWAEYAKVDRTTDDSDDDDARRTANDLDVMSVARDQQAAESRLRFDLDLPSEAHDDIRLGPGLPLPEWDFKRAELVPDHCRLQPMRSRAATACELPPQLRGQARRLRAQFESLKPTRQWFRGQPDGIEPDVDAWIGHVAERARGEVPAEAGLFRDFRNAQRDLACLLLADLSLSTDSYVNDEQRVIDVIRDSLFLFAEALAATGDRFALAGFSSRKRSHVRYHEIKSFDEGYSADVRGRIATIRPGYYTRMGAAIRHASSELAKASASQRVLLILTDGKPNDLDKYEGRYGIEDTRHAIREARELGLEPFCVTIDERANDYLPYLFGANNYVLVRDAQELPRKLPQLYLRLTK
jgi:nitric oxide reductase NorD protein